MKHEPKTLLMRRVEQEMGEPMEALLRRLIAEYGQTGTARKLNVAPANIGYWLLRLGLRVESVVVGQDEEIKVVKRGIHS